jgi:hypothetical protein
MTQAPRSSRAAQMISRLCSREVTHANPSLRPSKPLEFWCRYLRVRLTHRSRKADSNHRSRSEKSGRSETRASASCIAQPTRAARKRYRRGRASGSRRSDHSNTATAVGAAGETCGLNSGNLNILSEARIHAPELISDQVSVDPTEEVLCPSLVSREVRR